MRDAIALQLGRELAQLDLVLSLDQQADLVTYIELMCRWNRAYNLTAVRDPIAMVTRHLSDSLAIASLIPTATVLDVGTGPGLPGIPLAIALPGQNFHLLDANGKKTRFLFQVKSQLHLTNIEIKETRVENFQVEQGYDCVVSRAFASLGLMVKSCRHLLSKQGRILAMKSASVHTELEEIADVAELIALKEIKVPGLEETRYVVELAIRS
ncbi:16S rRNA (guanine(527)-N(7))-methyltransferase RsmG [Luminiphilus sp. nBUS_16]|uniref:16S rRNA (guanine(527)-N(7))-methyltransferase RsmG n=1 Tax=Luminiphilus sp. nBUS_16 TaxID=3395315 RepID=UPI003EC06F49